jgi:hypothetical protein
MKDSLIVRLEAKMNASQEQMLASMDVFREKLGKKKTYLEKREAG